MTEWMLRRGRRPPVGPVATERLIRAIRVGRVPPDTEASRVGSDDWRPYAQYPELELALDSSDVTERPSLGPPLPLDSERAGPSTARSPGAAAPARPSSPLAAPRLDPSDDDEDEDEAVTQVVSTPFAASQPEPGSEREARAPRPAAGVPPPKPPGWSSSRPGPPSQPAQPAATALPTAPSAPARPPAVAAVPRPAGIAAPPRPTPPRVSSPFAVPPPFSSSPRPALSRPSTPGALPPPPLSGPFAAPPVATSSPSASAGSPPPHDPDDDLDDEAMTHVVSSPAEIPTNRPPGLKARDAPELPSAPRTSHPHAPQSPVVSAGVFPPPAAATPLPVAPVMIAPPEPTRVRTPPPPPMSSYPPPPVLDGTTKALVALIIALSIGLTIVLFLLWRRS